MNDAFSEDLKVLVAGGFDACGQLENGQSYVEVRNLDVGSIAWNARKATILYPVPSNYKMGGGLDAFYVEKPFALVDGQKHQRMQSEHVILGRNWWLVSWHYIDAKPWSPQDNFVTHVHHCRLFFKQGARSN